MHSIIAEHGNQPLLTANKKIRKLCAGCFRESAPYTWIFRQRAGNASLLPSVEIIAGDLRIIKYKHQNDNEMSIREVYYAYRSKKERVGMVAERIKMLREQREMTQSELAKRLNITRSSVNAWEQGISVPSTQYIVELAALLHVSTDYLLGVDVTATVNVSGLTQQDIAVVSMLVEHLRRKNRHEEQR